MAAVDSGPGGVGWRPARAARPAPVDGGGTGSDWRPPGGHSQERGSGAEIAGGGGYDGMADRRTAALRGGDRPCESAPVNSLDLAPYPVVWRAAAGGARFAWVHAPSATEARRFAAQHWRVEVDEIELLEAPPAPVLAGEDEPA